MPGRIFVGSAISALVVGVGGNAIFTQDERHRSPLAAAANPRASVAPASAASAGRRTHRRHCRFGLGEGRGPAPALTGAPAASSASPPVSAATSPRAPAVPISVPKAAAAAVPAAHASGSVSRELRRQCGLGARKGAKRNQPPGKRSDWRSIARHTFRLLVRRPPGLTANY